MKPEKITGSEVAVPGPAQRATSLTESLPSIGEWFWVTVQEREDDEEEEFQFSVRKFARTKTNRRKRKGSTKPVKRIAEYLMCVEHVASNHVKFNYHKGEYENGVSLSFEDCMKYCRPAPEWRTALENQLEAVKQEMARQTRLLYDEAQKANALPPTNTQFAPTESSPFALAVRTLDPAKEKRTLERLKAKIPVVSKRIKDLAKEQAGLAQMLMLPELNNLYAMQKKLHVVEDKIFTLEVYAGLQEKVKQIADGAPAPADTKITVRQSLLFMDEETLFDFDQGGMDFERLEDFDEWVVKPESMARILPEQRGIVAFRVRRHEKDYGIPTTLWQAWANAEKNMLNFETYLLIRNGERAYRIASSVDFQPRLIPLKDEFGNAFTEVETSRHNFKAGKRDPDIVHRITPDHFDYDEHAEKLRDHLKQYNRVVVLLQGLLDRSECFHPHPPVNLAEQENMINWLNLVRDEEGALGAGSLSQTWEEYRDRCNSTLEPGDFIHTSYQDGRRRHYDAFKGTSNIWTVYKRRNGNKGDVVPYRSTGQGQHHRVETKGRPEEDCVGKDGVEVRWKASELYSYKIHDDYETTYRMWIPLDKVFNVMAYQPGNYKQFLCDRTQKGKYLKWAAPLLSAEKWHQETSTL